MAHFTLRNEHHALKWSITKATTENFLAGTFTYNNALSPSNILRENKITAWAIFHISTAGETSTMQAIEVWIPVLSVGEEDYPPTLNDHEVDISHGDKNEQK